MADPSMCYRELRSYKYQLTEDYALAIGVAAEQDFDGSFLSLTSTGKLTVKNRYAWDGPSGPTIDTANFMRSSLVHDALYQLMRERVLDYRVHREYTDDLLKRMCLEDGMSRFRAWYIHKMVHWFGEKNARPKAKVPEEVGCVP